MASPQTSNGFTKLANEIVEALAKITLSPYESRFLWVLWRKTYGFGKKEDRISESQFVLLTGMKRQHVWRTKARLIKRKIITQTGKKLSFNKDYELWLDCNLNRLHVQPKQVANLQPKQVDTKETKETNTKEISFSPLKGLKQSSKNMKIHTENEFSDVGEPNVDMLGDGSITKPTKKTNKNKDFYKFCDYFIKELEKKQGSAPVVGGIKDKTIFIKMCASYSVSDMQDIIQFFLTLEKAENNPTVAACFSNHTISLWRKNANKLNRLNN